MGGSNSGAVNVSKEEPPWLRENDQDLGAPQDLWDALIEKVGIATAAGLFNDREELKRQLITFWRRRQRRLLHAGECPL